MIDSYPSSNTSSFLTLNPADGLNADLPGPSSTYIPREASPLLPDLRRASEDSDDSDDEVLTQLPIYLSPSLHPNLHLLQYPLNHRSLSVPTWAMDRGKHISARVKEGVGRVEVEIPVDAGADVWREDRARDLGFVLDVDAVNGTRKGEEVEGGYGFGGRGAVTGTEKEKEKKKKRRKEEKWGDTVRLRSEVVPNATGYYSGIIHDGESLLFSVRRIESDEVVGALHLHPISKLLQMRTSLSYLDDHDVRLRERAPLNRERNGDDEEGEKEERRPKANGTAGRRPARPVKLRDDEENDGSGSIKDFRNKMRATAQREDEDKWVGYGWKEGDDPKVLQQMGALLLAEEKRVRLECRTRGLDYLNKA